MIEEYVGAGFRKVHLDCSMACADDKPPLNDEIIASRAARLCTVAGIPITELMDKATLDRLIQRTRDGGAEIVKYLKSGSAYYAPSAAATEMAEAILKDKKKILPCADRSVPFPNSSRCCAIAAAGTRKRSPIPRAFARR